MALKVSLVRILMVIALVAIVGWFVFRYLGIVGTARMPTASMASTIAPNSTVEFEKFSYWFREPDLGEIVLFKTSGIEGLPDDHLFMKRVIGRPGDHLLMSNGIIFLNDKIWIVTNSGGPILFPLPERSEVRFTNLVMRPGTFFLVGDNATNSNDSRFYGPVPRENIVGRVLLPDQRSGDLEHNETK